MYMCTLYVPYTYTMYVCKNNAYMYVLTRLCIQYVYELCVCTTLCRYYVYVPCVCTMCTYLAYNCIYI